MKKKRATPTDTAVNVPPKKRRSERVPEPKQLDSKAVSEASNKLSKTPKKQAKAVKNVSKAVDNVAAEKPTKTKTEKRKSKNTEATKPSEQAGGIRYWMMKAEPESRLENGVDVKFSIDDLAAKKEPEPWDGIRNHVAKNNLLAMRIGDLAFFYHSNCKVPGIVGMMEIVGEAIPDVTSWDPKSPYYDPKSSPEKPRWFCPLVKFRQKFNVPITLTQMKQEARLAEMQALKTSRLSVSKVSKEEWDYIMSLVENS